MKEITTTNVKMEYVVVVKRDSEASEILSKEYIVSEIDGARLSNSKYNSDFNHVYYILGGLSSNHPETFAPRMDLILEKLGKDNYQIIRTNVETITTRKCYTMAEAIDCCDSPDQYGDYENGVSEEFNRIYCL